MTWCSDGDDDQKKDEPKGGPEGGDYTPPVPIPGEGEALPEEEQR